MMLVGLGRPGANKIAIWRRLTPSPSPPPCSSSPSFFIWIVLSFKGRPLQSVHSPHCMHCIPRSDHQSEQRGGKSNVLIGCCTEWIYSAVVAVAASQQRRGYCCWCRPVQAGPQRWEDYLMSARDAASCKLSSFAFNLLHRRPCSHIRCGRLEMRARPVSRCLLINRGPAAPPFFIIDQHFSLILT